MAEGKSIAHRLDEKCRTEDIRLSKLAPFNKMVLSDALRRGLYQAGFVYPTVIQAAAIPLGNSGLDLLVQSKSGTGKTLIFCCIILENYRSEIVGPQSLIIAPTREIAVQIEEVINGIGRYMPEFRAVCVIGGLSAAEDRKRLQGAKAVVGTPGRILHLIQNEVLNTSKIRILVLDEADKMYTHSFRMDLKSLQAALPARKQTIACSATFCDNLDNELAKIMRQPMLISTEKRATTLMGIKQFVLQLPANLKTSALEMQAKLDALRYIFGRLEFKQCLIFAGSQSRADSYRNYLEKDGWPCDLMSGAQDQKTRLEIFRKFRDFKTRILIATDLMSRGVDSEHVNLVINVELPQDMVTYLHRVGRAGRFGSHGIAISFLASDKDEQVFAKFMNEIQSGMLVLKFPLKESTEDKENKRDLWDFSCPEMDAKCFGVFNISADKSLAPLASQDVSLSTTTTTTTSDQSSIDTKTFQIDSKDSAVNIPLLNNVEGKDEEAQHPSPAITQQYLQVLTPSTSQHGSSQYLVSSNTIDDASSIAADSLQSSQQDISRYKLLVMQKSIQHHLVEFLVDDDSSHENSGMGEHSKKQKTPQKVDLFDDYTKEVLNDEQSTHTESSSTVDEASLSSQKLSKLKSLLIDKSTEDNRKTPPSDLYADFAKYQEEETRTEEIDKNTFILSVATPSVAQESLEEIQNISMPTGPTTTVSSSSSEVAIKHFASPVHNQQDPQRISKMQQLNLTINKGTQIEIPPYEASSDETPTPPPFLVHLESPNWSETDDTTTPHSSGFDEVIVTNYSLNNSEMNSSRQDDEIHLEQKGDASDDDNASILEYFNGTQTSESEESDASEDSMALLAPFQQILNRDMLFGSNSTGSSDSQHTFNVVNESALNRWVDIYWNQITVVQDYVKLFTYVSQHQDINGS